MKRTTGLISNNPVAVLGMALPFIIVPATDTKSAFMISAFIASATIPCAVLASVLKDKIKAVIAVPFYSLLAMFIIIALKASIDGYSRMFDDLGVYIPLIALNSIMLDISATNPRSNWKKAAADAIMLCAGFALVCCLIGAIREMLLMHSVLGVEIKVYPIRLYGVSLPFFGFILIGFITAFFRSLDRLIQRIMLSSEGDNLKKKEKSSERAGDRA